MSRHGVARSQSGPGRRSCGLALFVIAGASAQCAAAGMAQGGESCGIVSVVELCELAGRTRHSRAGCGQVG